MRDRYDVIVLGAGLAGLTLARQLLLETDKSVLMLERRPVVPPRRQKVGESTVQLAGHYLGKVLDLEEHLLRHHFMKYNLRFYWPASEAGSGDLAGYSQSYIREISNVPSYQVDRNALEGELLRRNTADPRFSLLPAVSRLEVALADEGPHRVELRVGREQRSVSADWVVDATGRGRHLARRLGLRRDTSIRHGAFFWWVDGLVDVERLSERTPRERRLSRDRRHLGHLPSWLATNHFVAEGLWFWVIPLHGKTSLGLVYDTDVVPHEEVCSVEKATRFVCERFPLFARDLPGRRVLDFGAFKRFSHDSARTLSAARWAATGEAGRFSDPLYSPGSDLIAIHNTLIVDAIRTGDRRELAAKCASYEQLLRAAFAAYEPSYATSYDALGDQEVFALKYAWELSVYFGFYVFPFLNELLTERRFVPSYLRAFSRLGAVNAGLQRLLSGFYRWKRERGAGVGEPLFFDFTDLGPLAKARDTFYEVGVSVEEAREVLASQLGNLEELARFVAAWVGSRVCDEPDLTTRRDFVEGIDLEALVFDAAEIERRGRASRDAAGTYTWSFDAAVLEPFRQARWPAGRPASEPAGLLQEATA